jgi:Protein of unknown function (DUF664)
MPRERPPYAADEREMLLAFLDFQRESMVMKLEGLSEDQGRIAPTATSNSLMSLVQHLGWVEIWWFRANFLGEACEFPWSDGDMDADLRVAEETTIPGLIDFYRAQWARSNEIAREAGDLDDDAKYTERTDGTPTLRWIINHMIAETARHAGHADITRELIDGSTGF